MKYKVSLAAVNVPEETYPLMDKALRDGKIGQTEIIEEFEEALSRYVGSKYCIAVCNGTMADAVGIAALKVMHGMAFTKVVIPAITFIAQPNSARYYGLEVIFADVQENWLIDQYSDFGNWDSGAFIFATSLMGRVENRPFDMEDACEAFGSRFNGVCAGRFSKVGTYSFYPSHTISTGEGGAIVTDDERIADICRAIRSHGARATDAVNKFHFPLFGFNARMSSLNAVLGIALMKHIDEYVASRRKIFQYMQQHLGGFDEREGEEIVPHGYPVEFATERERDLAMYNLLEAGIECRKFFSCIPKEENYYIQRGNFPVAEHIAHTHLYVPCHQNMSIEDAEYVCYILQDQKGRLNKLVNHNGNGTHEEDEA